MRRRRFLAGMTALLGLPALAGPARRASRPGDLTLFLAGDVMLGRGIDQILPHSVDPRLHERYVRSAARYVELAEAESGEIPDEVRFDYVWGDALAELGRVSPDARIINLETAVTTSDAPWPGKGIHYRMHPGNVPVLTAAGIDVCVLGNNHVMDWGRPGLVETLGSLRGRDLRTAGAGIDAADARRPAVVETAAGRVRVHSYGLPGAGVPRAWEATATEPGVNLLSEPGAAEAERVITEVEAHRRPGDRVVVSIHWGPNWGYAVPDAHRRFAHRLIDSGAVDAIHGHSSHHPKRIEVHRGRPILYGAGDLLNDYEGIGGRGEYRGDLTLVYFPTLGPTGELGALRMTPMRVRRFRLERATAMETAWLAETLDRHSRPLGVRVERADDGLVARWG
ncbi:MAG: CapA family protein [Longimicrobiales bacterium]|nr:CapA family protein [Longimicrobiales bacterium]